MKKAKVIPFDSIQKHAASPERKRRARRKQQQEKMKFRDHVWIFISEGLELILFPFILLVNLIKVAGKAIVSLFRK